MSRGELISTVYEWAAALPWGDADTRAAIAGATVDHWSRTGWGVA